MPLVDEVSRAIADAMKARDPETLGPLRMLKSALTMKEVEKGRPLEPQEDLQVVSSLVKQRRDAIEQFTRGERPDLADREAREIGVLERYLPPAASADDIASAVDEVVSSTNASGPADFGRVMKEVMARLAGRGADGKTVGEVVRARLSRTSKL